MVRIGDIEIGKRTLVIAEIGNNHEGDFDTAKQLVELAHREARLGPQHPRLLVEGQDAVGQPRPQAGSRAGGRQRGVAVGAPQPAGEAHPLTGVLQVFGKELLALDDGHATPG